MAIPALVQVKSGTGTTSPVTVNLTSPTTAGNCLVVAVAMGNSTTNPTVSGITLGGAAGNFAAAVTLSNNADANVAIWTDQNCAGGQTAVAVTLNAGTGAGNGYDVYVYEFSNVATSSAVDKTASAGAGSGNFSSGSTGTLASANEVAIGIGAGIGAVGAPTVAGPASPWTNQTAVSAARTAAVAGHQVVSATTALSYAGTSSTGRVGAAIVTLIGAANTTVALPVAQVTDAAPAPALSGAVPLAPAQVTSAAPAPVARVAVQLARAQVTAAAVPLSLPVFLPTARVTIAAPPPLAGPVTAVALVPARVGVTAYPFALSRQLLISLASQAGTDDYGNPIIEGIFAAAGRFEGPDAFFYDPDPGFGNLLTSVSGADGVDEFGNAFIAGTASYQDNGAFWSAVVLQGGSVAWYKATGPAGPWSSQAAIGFTFNALTGGGLNFTSPAGFTGNVGGIPFQVPVPTPSASAAAIIAALQQAGIFD